MKSGEAKSELPLPSQEAVNEYASLVLAGAAIEGLEDVAAGHVIEEGALDDALELKNLGKSTG